MINTIEVSEEALLSSSMQKTHLAAKAEPLTPLGSIQRSPDSLVGGEGQPSPSQEPYPASTLWA